MKMAYGSSQSSSSSGVERRHAARKPARGSASVKTQTGTLRGAAVDISPAGVCLTLPEPLQVGATYTLALHIEGQLEPEVSVLGRVCFCIEHSGRYRVGVNCSLDDCFR
ncbi:MAG TPA: PilZ domain-containing protein [Steroidobacter sp.]|jgi:hypothetical protein|nr:PilZ domain-containing protein [Steroidobacter sp.]